MAEEVTEKAKGKNELWFAGKAVLCEGGPRDGWAYFLDDIEEMVRIWGRNGKVFNYRPTKRTVIHPRTRGKITSVIWEYVKTQDELAREAKHLTDVLAAVVKLGRAGGTSSSIAKLIEEPIGMPELRDALRALVARGEVDVNDWVDPYYRQAVSSATQSDT
jgi:hypothetical protein